MDRFKDKYRNCDALLIDDIQFLSGKNQIQEEFFHTFEELRNDGKQIIMTADKHPKQIARITSYNVCYTKLLRGSQKRSVELWEISRSCHNETFSIAGIA